MNYEDKLDVLLRLGREISHENDLETLLESICNFTTELVTADRCSIFLYDPENNELYSKVAHGVGELRFPADKGLIGAAIKTREIQVSTDAYNDIRFNKEIDLSSGYQTNTVLVVPFFNKDNEVIGAIEAINKNTGHFDNLDAELLVLIGNYVGSTIENTLLTKRIIDTQTNLIYKLSTMAEFKDEETSAHTKRVALYSAVIAEELGFSSEDLNSLVVAAPMHDVGKVGIPDSIIRKPGKLDPDEFDVMKKHSMIGFNILHDESNEMLRMAALVSRDHHERWDGTGYPQLLAEESISIEGRIVAIADVFDALTSRRPYKSPWSLDDSMAYIKENSGKHFDPKLGKIFSNNLTRVSEIYTKYRED